MYINLDTPVKDIQNLFFQIGFFNDENEHILAIEKPGEGNMNVVLRVKTNLRSFIAKQSRPYVQKYQDVAAPVNRIDVEYQFYATATNESITKHTPKILAYNKAHNLLFLEDLGTCEDMSFLYKTRNINAEQINLLVNIIANIHASIVSDSYPENLALRTLNHQHIFVLPFTKDNGFSLDTIQEGLSSLAMPYQTDEALKNAISKIGEKYLTEGNVLLHGDYYPGSWMQKNEHIFVIDPEFSFKGFPEFDLGVLAAHCIIITMNKDLLVQIEQQYNRNIDASLLAQITGVEIMRRLIGLAQLPLEYNLAEKKTLLEIAYELIMKTSK